MGVNSGVFVVAVLSLPFSRVSLSRTQVFLALWSAARDKQGDVSFWHPTLTEAIVPALVMLGLGLVASLFVAGLLWGDERRRMPQPGPLPNHLLEHMTMPSNV